MKINMNGDMVAGMSIVLGLGSAATAIIPSMGVVRWLWPDMEEGAGFDFLLSLPPSVGLGCVVGVVFGLCLTLVVNHLHAKPKVYAPEKDQKAA